MKTILDRFDRSPLWLRLATIFILTGVLVGGLYTVRKNSADQVTVVKQEAKKTGSLPIKKKDPKKAKEEGSDFFSTVLSISPMTNVNYINEIGEKYSKEYDIPFLFADFKKKNRYLRSVQISKELNMYRQEYCGCIFSKVEKEQRDREKALKEKQEGEVKND